MKKKFITCLVLCLFCFIMVVCFSKLGINTNHYYEPIPHSSVYKIGLNKLRNSVPSDEGLTITSHRIQYDKENDAFTITFDYIAPNHQGYMERNTKTFQVTHEEVI